jgi:hypothetical protein
LSTLYSTLVTAGVQHGERKSFVFALMLSKQH